MIRYTKIFAYIFTGMLFSCGKSSKEDLTEEPYMEVADIPKSGTEDGHETFQHKWGDSTYTMQKYFVVFLKKGMTRDQDSVTAAKIQEAHLAHLEKMYTAGKVSLVGPFDGDEDIQGIIVFHTPTLKEADSLANLDPAVKAGRLVVETHAWWAAKGSALK